MIVMDAAPATVHTHARARWAEAWGYTMDLIEQFAVYQRGIGWTSSTIDRRSRTLRALAAHLAPADITTATRDHLEEFLFAKPHPATRHAYRSDVRVFYRWCFERGVIDANPADLLHSIKVPKRLPRPIGLEALAATKAGNERTCLMVALGLFAGLRASEIASLETTDVDLNAMVLMVRHGKGGKDRVVDIHDTLGAMLRPFLATPGPIFRNRHGRAIQGRSVSATIKRQLSALGIEGSAHRLRHQFGTSLTRQTNGDLVTVGAVMGHSSPETTMGYVGWAGRAREHVRALYSDDGGDAA